MRNLLAAIHFIWASLVFVTSMVFVLPFIVFCTLAFSHKKAQDSAFVFLRFWAWVFSTFSLYSCRKIASRQIDANKAYIYVSNHGSFLDSVMLVRSIPQSFKPLGKIEMARTPIFGTIYKRVVVMIDRSSRESREKCVAVLKEELARGQSILIFPEGTMNRTDRPLTDFYDGAFRIAIETQTPIAPVVVLNASKLLPRNAPYVRMRPGLVTTVFAEPVDVNGLTLDDLPKLKSRVYKQMEQLILANTAVPEPAFVN